MSNLQASIQSSVPLPEKDRDVIIARAVRFFEKEVFARHVAKIDELQLDDLQLNPFLDKYKAKALRGVVSARTVSEGLVYPRVLGTSLNTIFGNKAQKFTSEVLEATGSGVGGMDIEFTDKTTGRPLFCQLKAGPNTINSDDVDPILGKFKAARRLLNTNNRVVAHDQFVLGVLYGTADSLSGHYKKIQEDYPILVGQDFWHRLTGQSDFYDRLTDAVGESAANFDVGDKIEASISRIARALEKDPGFAFD